MRLLVDTHAFLWAITNAPDLSNTARESLLAPGNDLFFSAASAWELAIKVSVGKLEIRLPLKELLDMTIRDMGIRFLPIGLAHAVGVQDLPFHHRDPFDRLLVAQARAEGLALLSSDAIFDLYGIQRIW